MAMKVWLLIPLSLMLVSCRPRDLPSAVSPCLYPVSAFTGVAAFSEVESFLKAGSGVAGSAGASNAAAYLAVRLQEKGVRVIVDAFENITPDGVKMFRNVIGIIPGTQDRIVILGAHYDLKAGIDRFSGANDSGSGVGLLLALAHVLQGPNKGPEVWLAFFDGEECLVSYGEHDGLHGSRHLAGKLVAEGRAPRVRAFILADMIGDKDLTVTIPRNGDPALMSAVFTAASAAGVRESFSLLDHPVIDDHQPFLERGIPSIDLIDFQYGSAPRFNDYWHTPHDTLDKLSADSLEVVGRVILRVLNSLADQSTSAIFKADN